MRRVNEQNYVGENRTSRGFFELGKIFQEEIAGAKEERACACSLEGNLNQRAMNRKQRHMMASFAKHSRLEIICFGQEKNCR